MATYEEIGDVIMELYMHDCLITSDTVMDLLKNYGYTIDNDTQTIVNEILNKDFYDPKQLIESYFNFNGKIVKELGTFNIPIQYYITKINRSKDEFSELDFDSLSLEFVPVNKDFLTKNNMKRYCVLN